MAVKRSLPPDIRNGARRAATAMAKYLAMVEYGEPITRQEKAYNATMKTVDALASTTGMDSAEVWRQVEAEAKRARDKRVMRGPGVEY